MHGESLCLDLLLLTSLVSYADFMLGSYKDMAGTWCAIIFLLPHVVLAGHDINYLALSGVLSVSSFIRAPGGATFSYMGIASRCYPALSRNQRFP